MTDEQIIEEIKADWESLEERVFIFVREIQTNHSGVIPVFKDEYPWSKDDLLKRKVDSVGIDKIIDQLPTKPPQRELDELIEKLTRRQLDPEIHQRVNNYHGLLENRRLVKSEQLKKHKKKLSPILSFERQDGLLVSTAKCIGLGRLSLLEALRRIDMQLEFLEDKKNIIIMSAFERGKNGPKVRKNIFADGVWEYFFQETYTFFSKYGGIPSESKGASLPVCRQSAAFLITLFPNIFKFYDDGTEGLARRIRSRLNYKRKISKN